jgi:hypothetical protein
LLSSSWVIVEPLLKIATGEPLFTYAKLSINYCFRNKKSSALLRRLFY